MPIKVDSFNSISLSPISGPTAPTHKAPSSTQNSSSIESATRSSLPTSNSRPVLPPPQSMGTLMSGLVDRFEKSRSDQLHFDLEALQLTSEKIGVTSIEQAKALKQISDQVGKQDTWSFLKHCSYSISGAASLIIGGALMAKGDLGSFGDPVSMLSGASLFLSGLSTIGSSLAERVSDSHFASALAMASAAFGLIGSTGASLSNPDILSASILNGVFSLAQGGATFGLKMGEVKLKEFEATLTHIFNQLSIDQHYSAEITSRASRSAHLADIVKKAQEALKVYTDAMINITYATPG